MFKPLRLSDAITVFSVEDPAIDWDKVDDSGKDKDTKKRELYLKAIKDPSVLAKSLQFKEGLQPTSFTVGVVPPDILTRLQDEFGVEKPNSLRWGCFLNGLRDVSWPTPPKTRSVEGTSYVDPEWIKQTFVRGLHARACEVGMYVLAFNRLTDDEVRL